MIGALRVKMSALSSAVAFIVFDLILYALVNNFSVMLGQVFLG